MIARGKAAYGQNANDVKLLMKRTMITHNTREVKW